ncbi:MAG: hypothetical protein ACU0GG_08580 [Paracoccaceae bacterium]
MTGRALILGLMLTTAVSGCARVADSRLNPFNWFGSAELESTASATVEIEEDERPRVAQITSLRIEPTPTGAIVRATGLPPTQGWYDVELVPESDGPVNGEMVYVMRAAAPDGALRTSTVQSREVSAGRVLSQQDLAATRLVRVIGGQNALVARR